MMKWMRLATAFPRDPKIRALTRSERLLYLELLLWSVEQETAGRIPASALGLVGDGHKGKHASLRKMVGLGLLALGDTSPGTYTGTYTGTYHLVNFQKWQMVTERNANKSAGQAAASDQPRAGVRAQVRREDQNGLIDQLEDQLARGELVEVRDPRLKGVLDRMAHRLNGAKHG